MTLADIDPEDLELQREREERRADHRWQRERDREAADWAKGNGRIVE